MSFHFEQDVPNVKTLDTVYDRQESNLSSAVWADIKEQTTAHPATAAPKFLDLNTDSLFGVSSRADQAALTKDGAKESKVTSKINESSFGDLAARKVGVRTEEPTSAKAKEVETKQETKKEDNDVLDFGNFKDQLRDFLQPIGSKAEDVYELAKERLNDKADNVRDSYKEVKDDVRDFINGFINDAKELGNNPHPESDRNNSEGIESLVASIADAIRNGINLPERVKDGNSFEQEITQAIEAARQQQEAAQVAYLTAMIAAAIALTAATTAAGTLAVPAAAGIAALSGVASAFTGAGAAGLGSVLSGGAFAGALGVGAVEAGALGTEGSVFSSLVRTGAIVGSSVLGEGLKELLKIHKDLNKSADETLNVGFGVIKGTADDGTRRVREAAENVKDRILDPVKDNIEAGVKKLLG